MKKALQQKSMKQKEIDSSQSKYGDHEESTLLTSGSQSGQSIRTKNPSPTPYQRDENTKGCTWAICLTVLFCIAFSVVVYRYANSDYGFSRVQNLTTKPQQIQPASNNKAQQQQNPKQQATHQSTTETNQQSSLTIQQLTKPPSNSSTLSNPTPRFPHPYTIYLFTKSTNTDYAHNIEHYASPDKSNVQRINISTYKDVIKSKNVLKALELVDVLELSEQKKEEFVQHLVMFTLLEENGGLIVGGDLVFTEGIDEKLMAQVNENNEKFGIFTYIDERLQKGNQNQHESVSLSINIENYFIAASQHFPYLKSLVTQMTSAFEKQIASTFPSSQNLLKRYKMEFNQLIQIHHQEFASLSKKPDSFLEYLKIFSFGRLDKLNIGQPELFDFTLPQHFQYLSGYDEYAFKDLVGPLNSVVQLPLKAYDTFLKQLTMSPDHPVVSDSFLYRHMLSFSSIYLTVKPVTTDSDPQRHIPWKLPKILWTFINKLDQKSPLHDYFIANLLNNIQSSDFELIVLTEETIQAALDGKELHQIFSNFKDIQTQQQLAQNQQLLSQLVKWYVLKDYGGVFVDFGYFLFEKIDWLTHIKSNGHVFNNLHEFPDVLLFQDHSKTQEWSVNINSGTKIAHNVTYLTKGFVAAVKNVSFVTDQLNTLQLQLKSSKDPNPQSSQSSSSQSEKQPYEIWSINSLMGGSKFDLSAKSQSSECYVFTDSLQTFRQKYGALGYVSELTTSAKKEQLDDQLSYLDEDSIFWPFFINKDIDSKEIEKIKSLNKVSLSVQKIQK